MVSCAVQIHWTRSKVPSQISGDLFCFQISRTKESVHISGGFRAREATVGSHLSVSSRMVTLEQIIKRPARLEMVSKLSCEGRNLCSGGVGWSEPGARSISLSASLQGLLTSLEEANCINTIRRSVTSCVHPASAGKNSRHGITIAVGGLRLTGQDGQATTPAAHVQTREHFGTGPKNAKKNTGAQLWAKEIRT